MKVIRIYIRDHILPRIDCKDGALRQTGEFV